MKLPSNLCIFFFTFLTSAGHVLASSKKTVTLTDPTGCNVDTLEYEREGNTVTLINRDFGSKAVLTMKGNVMHFKGKNATVMVIRDKTDLYFPRQLLYVEDEYDSEDDIAKAIENSLRYMHGGDLLVQDEDDISKAIRLSLEDQKGSDNVPEDNSAREEDSEPEDDSKSENGPEPEDNPAHWDNTSETTHSFTPEQNGVDGIQEENTLNSANVDVPEWEEEKLVGRPMTHEEQFSATIPFKASSRGRVLLKEDDLVVVVLKAKEEEEIGLMELLIELFEVEPGKAIDVGKAEDLGKMVELEKYHAFKEMKMHIVEMHCTQFMSSSTITEEKKLPAHDSDQTFKIDTLATFQGTPSENIRKSRPESDELSLAINSANPDEGPKAMAKATMDSNGKDLKIETKGGACALVARDGHIINSVDLLPYKVHCSPSLMPDHDEKYTVGVQSGDVIILYAPLGEKAKNSLHTWAFTIGFKAEDSQEAFESGFNNLANGDCSVVISRIITKE